MLVCYDMKILFLYIIGGFMKNMKSFWRILIYFNSKKCLNSNNPIWVVKNNVETNEKCLGMLKNIVWYSHAFEIIFIIL